MWSFGSDESLVTHYSNGPFEVSPDALNSTPYPTVNSSQTLYKNDIHNSVATYESKVTPALHLFLLIFWLQGIFGWKKLGGNVNLLHLDHGNLFSSWSTSQVHHIKPIPLSIIIKCNCRSLCQCGIVFELSLEQHGLWIGNFFGKFTRMRSQLCCRSGWDCSSLTSTTSTWLQS